MSDLNRVFNNQVGVNGTTSYFATEQLKKKIVKQLAGKTSAQQEAIIEQLLKLLDIKLISGAGHGLCRCRREPRSIVVRHHRLRTNHSQKGNKLWIKSN